jgi:hypothetical protein
MRNIDKARSPDTCGSSDLLRDPDFVRRFCCIGHYGKFGVTVVALRSGVVGGRGCSRSVEESASGVSAQLSELR